MIPICADCVTDISFFFFGGGGGRWRSDTSWWERRGGGVTKRFLEVSRGDYILCVCVCVHCALTSLRQIAWGRTGMPVRTFSKAKNVFLKNCR